MGRAEAEIVDVQFRVFVAGLGCPARNVSHAMPSGVCRA